VSEQELKDLVGAHRAFSPRQQATLSEAFEITERTSRCCGRYLTWWY
jgi:hypothetical protein